MKPTLVTSDYFTFLANLKGRIQAARLHAGRAINRELILLYWDIGRGIVEKQATEGWGEPVVERREAPEQVSRGTAARVTDLQL